MLRKWLPIGVIPALLVMACRGVSSPKKVKIAVVIPLNRSYGKAMENSIRLALEEAHGQAGDVPVELVILDSTDPQVCPGDNPFSADVELKLVQRVIDDPQVVVYMGSLGSDQAEATMAMLNRAGLAQISLSGSWPGLTKPGYGPGEPGVYFPTGRRHFFRMSATDDAQGAAAARWAKALGFNKVYVVHDTGTYSSGLAGIFEVTAADLGLRIVGSEAYDLQAWGPEELEKTAARVVAAGANLLYYPAQSGDPVTVQFIIRVKKLTPNIQIMAGDGLANTMVDVLPPEYLEGLMATDINIVARDLEGEVAAAFAARYKAKYGEELTSSLGTVAYEAMGAILQAIAKAEEPTREGVLAQLQKIEYSGIFGTWHFDERGDITPAVIACLQVRNGVWTFVQPLK